MGGSAEESRSSSFSIIFFAHVRATRTRTLGRDSLFCVHFCAGFCKCWAVGVQHDLHTFWRFAGTFCFSKIPSVSAALWAACIHSFVGGATPESSTAMSSEFSTREADMVFAQVNFTLRKDTHTTVRVCNGRPEPSNQNPTSPDTHHPWHHVQCAVATAIPSQWVLTIVMPTALNTNTFLSCDARYKVWFYSRQSADRTCRWLADNTESQSTVAVHTLAHCQPGAPEPPARGYHVGAQSRAPSISRPHSVLPVFAVPGCHSSVTPAL